MKVKKKTVIFVFIPMVIFICSVMLFQSVLFHMNPIKLGFREHKGSNYSIFSKNEIHTDDIASIEHAISRNEILLSLKYKNRIQVILCESQADLSFYQPQLSHDDRVNAVAVAPWPDTIYLTPRAKEKYGSLDAILMHESLHILLMQNFGLGSSIRIWKNYEWLAEGSAIYFSKWPVYTAKNQLSKEIENAGIDLSSGSLLGGKKNNSVWLPTRYSIYNYFTEYLVQSFGEERYKRFLTKTFANPKEIEIRFQEIFGKSISETVTAFYVMVKKSV
jgi:hypothetical protein